MVGGTNQLTITNNSNETWTLSKEVYASWLTLLNDKGEEVTTGGTGVFVVKATATANYTVADRTATITLARGDGNDPLYVKVTQAAPEPMSISSANFQFSYSGGTQTLTVTNPESGKDGFAWSLAQDAAETVGWLTATPATGTGGKDKVAFTTASINTSASARTATFALTRQGQNSISITVMQAGAPTSSLSPAAIVAEPGGGSYTFNVVSPAGIPWSLNCEESWLTVTPASGSGSATVTVNAQGNPSYTDPRDSRITLSREGLASDAVWLLVVQDKSIQPTPTCTPKIQYGSSKYTTGYIFTYGLNVPVGTKWTLKMDERYAASMGLYNYMWFVDPAQGRVQTLTGTGPGNIIVITTNYPASNVGYMGPL
ncbi:MAG: hypothetical protein LUE99_08795 [Bacteroides sp.]|nr:hypothetical protein [Bacteroides sp.]